MSRQFGADEAKRRRKSFGDVSYDVAEDRRIPEYVTHSSNQGALFLSGP